MFSMCGAVRCEDLDNCWACRGEQGPPTAAADEAAGGADSASVCKDPRVRTGRCGCESTVIEDGKTEGDEAIDEIASQPPVSAAAGWGYEPENGPLTWHHQYPTANGRRQLEQASLRLRAASAKPQERRIDRLAALAKLLDSYSYHNVLARGFALVRDEQGRPLRTAADVESGARLDIEFADGRVGAVAGVAAGPKKGAAKKPAKAGQGTLF